MQILLLQNLEVMKKLLLELQEASSDLVNDIGDEMHKILVSTGNFEIRRVDMVGPKSWWRT
jgi:preprotein translocase subunit SecF